MNFQFTNEICPDSGRKLFITQSLLFTDRRTIAASLNPTYICHMSQYTVIDSLPLVTIVT